MCTIGFGVAAVFWLYRLITARLQSADDGSHSTVGILCQLAMAAGMAIMFGVTAALFWFIGANAPAAFLAHFTVFVLACFIGYMVVWNVKPALHTPLMSVTNAISSIIAIGALVQISPITGATGRPDELIRWIAAAGIVLTAINMFGGFAVTQRMLAMFRK